MNKTPQANDTEVEAETKVIASVSRRRFLKKTAYQAPTLIVMGSLASVETAMAASCCPVGQSNCPPLVPPCGPG